MNNNFNSDIIINLIKSSVESDEVVDEIVLIQKILYTTFNELQQNYPFFHNLLLSINIESMYLEDYVDPIGINKKTNTIYINLYSFISILIIQKIEYPELSLLSFIQFMFIHEIMHKLLGIDKEYYTTTSLIRFVGYNKIALEFFEIAKEIEVNSALLDIIDNRLLNSIISISLLKFFRNFTFEEIVSFLFENFKIENKPIVKKNFDIISSNYIKNKNLINIINTINLKKANKTFMLHHKKTNKKYVLNIFDYLTYSYNIGDSNTSTEKNDTALRNNKGYSSDYDIPSRHKNIGLLNSYIINWAYILGPYINNWKGTKFNYSSFSRRVNFPPKRVRKINSPGDILFAIDTSSSIGINTLEKIKGELYNLLIFLKNYPTLRVSLIEFTDKITFFRPYIKNINDIKIIGDGNTDVRVIFDWISNNNFHQKTLVLIFTDGYTEYPENFIKFPVIWFFEDDSSSEISYPLFGKRYFITY